MRPFLEDEAGRLEDDTHGGYYKAVSADPERVWLDLDALMMDQKYTPECRLKVI